MPQERSKSKDLKQAILMSGTWFATTLVSGGLTLFVSVMIICTFQNLDCNFPKLGSQLLITLSLALSMGTIVNYSALKSEYNTSILKEIIYGSYFIILIIAAITITNSISENPVDNFMNIIIVFILNSVFTFVCTTVINYINIKHRAIA